MTKPNQVGEVVWNCPRPNGGRHDYIKKLALASGLSLACSLTPAAAATCIGTCGTSGANGVVGTSGASSTYQYISTASGVNGAGQIAGVGGSNGAQYTSSTFTAVANDPLTFLFNYVTNDGAGYADYAWAELRTSVGAHVAWLFTSRTQPSGNTSPGIGLPANDATLNPGATPIQSGTNWSGLGSSSGTCYASGCGNTGWIQSSYNIAAAGAYEVVYGVTNWGDSYYQSGLAFDALRVNGAAVDVAGVAGVPEPAAWALMLVGFGLMGSAMRKRRHTMRVTYA